MTKFVLLMKRKEAKQSDCWVYQGLLYNTTQSWVQPVLQPPHSPGFNQYNHHSPVSTSTTTTQSWVHQHYHHTVFGSPVQPPQSWVQPVQPHSHGFNQYYNHHTVLGSPVQPPHSPGFNQYSNHHTVLGSTSTTTTQSCVWPVQPPHSPGLNQ